MRTDDTDQQGGKALKRALGLLAAGAVAAAIGLATVDVPESDGTTHVLKTDANAHRPDGAVAPAPLPAMSPGRGELDPVLNVPDRGNDHHG